MTPKSGPNGELERYVSNLAGEIQLEHYHRYVFASTLTQGKTVLDIACGEGYGSAILAQDAAHVFGIDLSEETICKVKFQASNITFKAGNVLNIPLDDNSVDLAISFETLEHLGEQEQMIAELRRVLRVDGVLLISTPNRDVYNSFATDPNDFHVKELEQSEFETLLHSQFEAVQLFGQAHSSADHIFQSDAPMAHQNVVSISENGVDRSAFANVETKYFLALCSAKPKYLPKMTPSAAYSSSYNLASESKRLTAWAQSATRDVEARDEIVLDQQKQIYETCVWVDSLQGQHKFLVQERDTAVQERDTAVQEHSRLSQEHTRTKTQLFEMSDWAQSMDASPIRHAVKTVAWRVARKAYRVLPMPPSTKQALRSKLSRRLRPSNAMISAAPTPILAAPALTDPTPLSATFEYPETSKADVLLFSVIDWHFRIQRPQHLARGLAKLGHRVFYLSNHFSDRNESGYEIEQIEPGLPLFQIALNVPGAPTIYFEGPQPNDQAALQNSLSVLLHDFDIASSLSMVAHAYWYDTASSVPNSTLVYDCMDHHEGFGNVPQELIDLEKIILTNADLVTTTSLYLDDMAAKYTSSHTIVRNAGEYTHFATPPATVYKDPEGRQVIGYCGAIADWFDGKLIRSLSKAFPEHLILLVGGDTANVGKLLKSCKNVVFTGEVAYSEVPHYVHAFDVCLLPFQIIPLTLATNPVKVYEYLATGKPVVCVDLPEVEQFGEHSFKADTHEGFVDCVRMALCPEANTEDKISQRRAFAALQTWHHRVEELSASTDALTSTRVSIVILTYNNLDLTKACLESVYQVSDYHNLEVIIVDNASSDGTIEYLKALEGTRDDTIILLNENNLGFAAGNNVGLEAVTGEYIVLLNNDTVVTKGWITTLLRHFKRNANIGLLGPVTNNIGNEARIEIDYTDIADMPAAAARYTRAHMGKTIPMRTAAFFCVMMHKSTYETVGGLNEAFGRGFFEDDDYCRRVEQIGRTVLCAEDVFIHHHLSASFNKLKQAEKQKLFENNKKTYEDLWGEWIPHNYRK